MWLGDIKNKISDIITRFKNRSQPDWVDIESSPNYTVFDTSLNHRRTHMDTKLELKDYLVGTSKDHLINFPTECKTMYLVVKDENFPAGERLVGFDGDVYEFLEAAKDHFSKEDVISGGKIHRWHNVTMEIHPILVFGSTEGIISVTWFSPCPQFPKTNPDFPFKPRFIKDFQCMNRNLHRFEPVLLTPSIVHDMEVTLVKWDQELKNEGQ